VKVSQSSVQRGGIFKFYHSDSPWKWSFGTFGRLFCVRPCSLMFQLSSNSCPNEKVFWSTPRYFPHELY
jgi:hypothetical protein